MIRSPWTCVTVTAPFPHLLGDGDPEELMATSGRTIEVNGRLLEGAALASLSGVEQQLGFRLMTGQYWYDRRSGAFGRVGQPTAGFLPVGLALAGELPPHCSGGGTGIRVNGRELHDVDRRLLERRLGVLPPGRYFLDADGAFGRVGGPVDRHLGPVGRVDAA